MLFLKLILIANQNRSDSNHYAVQLKKKIDDKFLFQKLHWPLLLSQVDCNNNINFIFEMCKLVVLIRQLEQQSDVFKNVLDFIRERGFNSIENYATTFLLLVMEYYVGTSNNKSIFCIQANERLSNLLDPLCINGKNNVEYLTIKSFPLYKDEENYFILNWNYFANQIYIGTYIGLRDLLKEKGINSNLKSVIGYKLEANLMLPIIKTAFSHNAQKMKFDCEYVGNKGYPDAYIQIGHRIYLFEFKDSLLSEKVMESCDFETIKEHLEQTFIRSKRRKNGKEGIKDKAVCQLINYIENIVEEKYNCNELNIGYKKSYVIYPVILYTDYRYEISGFNDYLAKRFEEKIEDNLKLYQLLKRHKIMPLSFIGLEFFFNNMNAFQTKKIKLHQLIENYHEKIKKQVRMHEKTHIQDKFTHLYYPFERINYDYFFIMPPKEKEFPLVMKCFNIPFLHDEDESNSIDL